MLLLTPAAFTNCDKTMGDVCTDEFRMVTVSVQSAGGTPVVLDSVYTIRQSNGERINPEQPNSAGIYVVLDDSYHSRLRKTEDDFRFVGWRNNSVAVDEVYHISGDKCHINKHSGPVIVTIP